MKREGSVNFEAVLKLFQTDAQLEPVGLTAHGHQIAAYQNGGRVWFTHNLGAKAPTKIEAEAILKDMAETVSALATGSAEIAAHLSAHPPMFSLEVFSGPMDFLVAVWDGVSAIEWKTDLR